MSINYIFDRNIPKKVLNMIENSKYYIFCQTPWLWPPEEISSALKKSLERNVVIQIITRPVKKIGDKSHKKSVIELQMLGINFEFLPKIHGKTLVVDDREALVTSANVNIPSFLENKEDGIWIAENPVIINQIKKRFQDLWNDAFYHRFNGSMHNI